MFLQGTCATCCAPFLFKRQRGRRPDYCRPECRPDPERGKKRRPCCDCGKTVEHGKMMRCRACRDAYREAKKKGRRSKEYRFDCGYCGQPATAGVHNARYCESCRSSNGRGLKSHYRDRKHGVDKRHGPYTCAACGDEFFASHRAQRYCSKPCGWQSLRSRAEPSRRTRLAIRAECKVFAKWARKARTRRAARERKRQREIETAKRRSLIEPRACRECGVAFKPQTARNVVCSDECRGKEKRRQSRLKRKAKERAAKVEPVNATLVFQRDRWICQLCGRKTLRKQRGTCNPRAPELDHIVPLSQGGEHSYMNTQCTCRACNAAKSDEVRGQLRMFGGVFSG